MSPDFLSRYNIRKQQELSEPKTNLERTKRQRTMSYDLFDWFTLKHYPSIFLDQRLRSRFFK